MATCAYRSGALTLWRHVAGGIDGLLKTLHLGRDLARGGVILTFHRVLEQPDPFHPATDAQFFAELCAYLAKHYQVVDLETLEDFRRNGRIPPRCVSLSFDDGYLDTYEVAFPLLRQYGLPATVFITTGAIDRSCTLWFDRVCHIVKMTQADQAEPVLGVPIELGSVEGRVATIECLVEHLKLLDPIERDDVIAQLSQALGVNDFSVVANHLLTWDQLREMDANGFRAGAHTVTHPILSRAPLPQVVEELSGSKAMLEQQLNRPIELFAYPNGKEHDITPEVVAAVRSCGYRAAYTTIFGANRPGDDPFQLRRVTLYADRQAHAAVLLERFFYLQRSRLEASAPR